ncbi:hypothetical protein BU14_0381s0003 [Porphyra umbilicalis]|uniref:AAA+ ATPase domain-containing protein n=1 Tax=Porphyra umbilicalis TaxID=2786 RepID=A0A1X6NWV9_PORUM|nr:hypothetical protein BU14_0381s0003 [Porphyra umbilicalis]|eukprot:OSX73062.1 hypothetical protein BU14_0381s0003 [Porphyra umbilicalis]
MAGPTTSAPAGGTAVASTVFPFPVDTLRGVAAHAHVPFGELSLLEVIPSSCALTAAVLDYAALQAPPDAPRLARGDLPPRRALWINPSCSTVPPPPAHKDDADATVDAATAAAADAATAKIIDAVLGGDDTAARSVARKSLQAGGGEPRIKAGAGLGVTAVSWPPPPSLTARAVRASMQGGGAGAQGATADGADGPGEDNGAADASGTIYVVAHAVGPPVYVPSAGAPTLYRSLVLASASADGEAALAAFVDGVVQWHMAVNKTKPTRLRFGLYRFSASPCSTMGRWLSDGHHPGRRLSSVVLPDGMARDVVTDVLSFLSPTTKTWYRHHGLPYRRSYLLHGVPGSGKTSLIVALASTFQLTACFLTVTSGRFNNQLLGSALRSLPAHALLVLEDVDALFGGGRKATAAAGEVTFSGLLNALDGLAAADSVLVVLTTNMAVGDLDPALIRGGRVDRLWAFGPPTGAQLGDLFRSYYPGADAEVAASFGAAMEAGLGPGVSMAAAQQLFIRCRGGSAADAVAAVPSFCVEYRARRSEEGATEAVPAC